MLAGGVLAYLVLAPLIVIFGQLSGAASRRSANTLMQRHVRQRRSAMRYIIYIGAGAVATGGHHQHVAGAAADFRFDPLGLARPAPTGRGRRRGQRRGSRAPRAICRSEVVFVGSLAAGRGAWPRRPSWAWASTCTAWSARLLIVVFGFLFVTVSSRLTGEIGSSSNPISGMTVATLLLTCLVFVLARPHRQSGHAHGR